MKLIPLSHLIKSLGGGGNAGGPKGPHGKTNGLTSPEGQDPQKKKGADQPLMPPEKMIIQDKFFNMTALHSHDGHDYADFEGGEENFSGAL